MRRAVLSVSTLWLMAIAWQAPLVAAFPSPRGFVNDFAGVLDDSARNELESLLRDTERTTSAEVVLVTVRSLDGMTVEDYAVRLFQQWGIGKKKTDNGVLILISPSDRTMRIEVGYGLEPILPDGLAGEIIRNDFLPAFREADFPRGIRQGVSQVVDVVRKGEVAPRVIDRSDDSPPVWFVIPFLGVFVATGSFAIGLGIKSKTFAPIIFGGLFAGVALLLSLIFLQAALILVPVGIGMVAWGYSKGRSQYWTKTLRPSAGAVSSDGWMMGPSGSSDSSGGGGSSSSDFGGVSSGGGGASGRW